VAGQFTIRANVALELSTQAEIEAKSSAGKWKAYRDLDGGQGYRLIESCSAARPACRKLAAGEQLSLAAWTGSSCSAQCAPECPVDRFHPGIHRLVLHGCDSARQRYEGSPFEMAASARELWRWRAAAGIQRGSIFRLDARPPQDDQGRPPEHIASFRVLKGSERPLPPELLQSLAEWLRFRDGFVQFTLSKDCRPGPMVGILLEITAPRPEQQTVELALNLACNFVFISMRDGRAATTWVSHFDPSWAQIIAILRRALPQDQELEGIRESPTNFPTNFDK